MLIKGIAPEENFRNSFPCGQDLLPSEGLLDFVFQPLHCCSCLSAPSCFRASGTSLLPEGEEMLFFGCLHLSNQPNDHRCTSTNASILVCVVTKLTELYRRGERLSHASGKPGSLLRSLRRISLSLQKVSCLRLPKHTQTNSFVCLFILPSELAIIGIPERMGPFSGLKMLSLVYLLAFASKRATISMTEI